MTFLDVDLIRPGNRPDCQGPVPPAQPPAPAIYMVDGKPLCRFCFDALLPVAEIVP